MRVWHGCSFSKSIGHLLWRDYLLERAVFSHYVKCCRISTMRISAEGNWMLHPDIAGLAVVREQGEGAGCSF
jgi:hypothetical protein